MAVGDLTFYKYVPHGFEHAFERLGWEARPHILEGIHHGHYAVCMQWMGGGEPVIPGRDADEGK